MQNKYTLVLWLAVITLSSLSTMHILYAQEYYGTWVFTVWQQTISVGDININYVWQKSQSRDLYWTAYSIEKDMYSQPPSTTTTSSISQSVTPSVFKNAFDCILTRSMLDFSGNIPLELYTSYHMNPSSCMDSSASSQIVWSSVMKDPFITIGSYTIERENHSRPQNPAIEINPVVYSADRPQAWSQTTINVDNTESVGWYYNSLWAKAEWEYLWLYLPFASDYTLILSMDRSMLDLASWGYSTINYPLMISRDTGNAYYWTSHPTGQTGYIYGVYYDPLAGQSMEINVKSDANMMLPVRFVKW